MRHTDQGAILNVGEEVRRAAKLLKGSQDPNAKKAHEILTHALENFDNIMFDELSESWLPEMRALPGVRYDFDHGTSKLAHAIAHQILGLDNLKREFSLGDMKKLFPNSIGVNIQDLVHSGYLERTQSINGNDHQHQLYLLTDKAIEFFSKE